MFRRSKNNKRPNRIELFELPTIDPFKATDWIIAGASEDLISPQLMKEHLTSFKLLTNEIRRGEKSFFDYFPLMSTELEECNHFGKLFAGYMKEAEHPLNASNRHNHYLEIGDAWNPYNAKKIAELSRHANKLETQIQKEGYELIHDLLSASFRAARYLSQEGFHERSEEVLTLGQKLAMGSAHFMINALNANQKVEKSSSPEDQREMHPKPFDIGT